MVWNSLDLFIAAFRRGKGIPPQVHVFADCMLFIGVATSAGFVMVDISDWVGNWDEYRHDVPEKIAAGCLLVLVMYVIPPRTDPD